MATTNTVCGCSDFNKAICAKRAARGLACFAVMPTPTTEPAWLTKGEAEELAARTGGVCRVGRHGLVGTARKWMVVARSVAS